MSMKSSRVIGTLMLALSAMPAAQAYDFQDASGYYNFSGQTRRSVYVTYASLQDNLDAYKGAVVIPQSVTYLGKDIPVKGIGDHALFNCQFVTSATLPEGVGYILEQAFSHCYSMRSISLPSTLELIGDYAFEFCDDMTSVTLPASVSEFGYAVFSNCLGLKEIKVQEGNPILEDADGVLMMKGGETLVQYPAGRSDTEFTVPAQVKTITDYAFSPAPNLTKISLGENVGTINPLTFCDCAALGFISVDANNSVMTDVDGVLYDKAVTTLLQYPRGRSDVEYELPSTVTALGELSLAGCGNLRSLVMPENMASLEIYSMQGTSLESLTVKAHIPPQVALDAFDQNIYSTATLYVHEADIDAYRSNSAWKRFRNIRTIESAGLFAPATGETGVTIKGNLVTAPSGSVIKAFDACGRVVASGTGSLKLPARGVYIVEVGSHRIKVIM